MNQQRGRPMILLARMAGEPLQEIRNAYKYGSRAWRFILLRQQRRTAAERVQAFDRLWNKLRAKNKGKPPKREEWLKKRDQLLEQLRPRDDSGIITESEAARLWREFLQQFERALMSSDDDWLNDLAKAIRGEAQPEYGAKFTAKVLELLQRKPDAKPPDIFADEDLKKRYLDKLPNGRPDVTGRIKVEGWPWPFEKKQRVLDAINDIRKTVAPRKPRAPVRPLMNDPKLSGIFAHQFLRAHPELRLPIAKRERARIL